MTVAKHANAIENAQAYLKQEQNYEYRRQVEELLENLQTNPENGEELEDRFGISLSFGTAGLRGKMEAGFNRMNRITVAKAAWALGHFLSLEEQFSKEKLRTAGVVIGFDGRLNSAQFAEDVASILAGFNIAVHIFTAHVPTPFCAFAIGEVQALAGVMVTASHNPPMDNGIKIYGANGAQITSPCTNQIAELMVQAPEYSSIVRLEKQQQQDKKLRKEIGPSISNSYFLQLANQRFHDFSKLGSPLKIVYTPMHGVGGSFVLRGLKEAGFENIEVVKEQFNPDGNFPTVLFPNPEEEGALDLALALAQKCNADLILASDPDADRLAVWIRKNNTFVPLSGNEVGWLLGEDALTFSRAHNKLVMTTLVSSQMLASIARSHEAHIAIAKTGFSNIARQASEREKKFGEKFIFGYEEALGYSVGTLVRDKDGVSAAIRFAELAEYLRRKNSTVHEELQRLMRVHGIHQTLQWSLRLEGSNTLPKMRVIMAKIREKSALEPLFDQYPLKSAEDLLDGSSDIGKADIMLFYFANGARLIVRPSGTEPKIKFYLENIGRLESGKGEEKVISDLSHVQNSIKKILMQCL